MSGNSFFLFTVWIACAESLAMRVMAGVLLVLILVMAVLPVTHKSQFSNYTTLYLTDSISTDSSPW